MVGRWRALLLVVLLVTAAFAWLRTMVRDRGASDDDWRSLASSIHVTAGDAVVVLPAWQLRALMFLPAHQVISADGLSDWPMAMLHRHPRLWVIDEHHALDHLPSTMITTALRTSTVVATHGPLQARLWTAAHATQPLTVIDATITLDDNKRAGVAHRWTLATENGVHAMTMQAPASPSRLRMKWQLPTVQRSLVVFAGHPRDSARLGSAVTIGVVVDGVVLATIERSPGFAIDPNRRTLRDWFVPTANHDDQRGYRADVIDLSSLPQGPHDLELQVTALGASTSFAIDAFLSDAP
jgi:hypothetical protein